MEEHQLFFTPQTLPMDTIPHDDDLMNNNTFDTTITSYEPVFDEFMLFGNGYDGNGLRPMVENIFDGEGEGTSSFDLCIDAVEDSPDAYLPVDGNASASPEEKQGDGNSSWGTRNVAKSRRDRSKTLISERRRRGRMKEKLYELRSLVPNITKMDKASIIADALVYVQNLQRQAKKLVEEITMLESSSKVDMVSRIPFENTMNVSQVDKGRSSTPSGGKVLRLIAHEVGEGRFYVRLECSKGEGVSSALYSAIESLGCFDLESSNISIASEAYVLTITLHVRGYVEEMNVSTVKLWIMGAILKEGFEFEMTAIF